MWVRRYYYFAHNADSHELRFAHQSTASPVLGTLTYNGNPAGNRPFAGLWQFEYCRQVTTNRQTLRDYTFLNPNYNLEHQHSSPSTALTDNNRSTHAQSAVNSQDVSHYEKYDYPGRYQRDEQGKQCSRYRLEAEIAQFEYCRQVTTNRQTLRDYTFLNPNYNLEHQHSSPSTALTDNNRSTHAQSAVNANSTQSAVNSHRVSSHYEKYDYPGRYQRDEQGKQCSRYRLEAEIALSETANATGDDMRLIPGYGFTRGTQVAHVAGPQGEEIYCNQWGSVKLQFPWDREGRFDEHSSCWVRVVQDCVMVQNQDKL
ncbi:type VI secretion system tip protein VgrG [Aggregatibacter actinomycetemcomitans]|uniref:Type VI secretion system tip protein VgrG n=1 Tax=Aggregatibacter actinomycetemcomitans TaxID=714 RepID=A0A2G1DMY9_AGGAC|nr:type VI secretion system tip protein VgrG [Aggregatibacter actinomycetemcomitans]